MLIRLLLAAITLTFAVLIPLRFDYMVSLIVASMGLGWVLTTILLRVLVILLFALALKFIFSSFAKTQRVRNWIVLLIAILPGFGISFIAPIYITDYGMLTDDLKLENIEVLEAAIGGKLVSESGYSFVVFFTTSCPHCKAASEKIGTNIEAGQKIPVTAIFPGEEGDTKAFLEKHKGQKFTHFLLNNDPLFIDLSGGTFPSMFLLDNQGKTIYHWTGDQLNYSGLDYLKSLEH